MREREREWKSWKRKLRETERERVQLNGQCSFGMEPKKGNETSINLMDDTDERNGALSYSLSLSLFPKKGQWERESKKVTILTLTFRFEICAEEWIKRNVSWKESINEGKKLERVEWLGNGWGMNGLERTKERERERLSQRARVRVKRERNERERELKHL